MGYPREVPDLVCFGPTRFGPNWEVNFAVPFWQSLNDSTLMLWRPELAFYIEISGPNEQVDSTEKRFALWRDEMSRSNGYNFQQSTQSGLPIFSCSERYSQHEPPAYNQILASEGGTLRVRAAYRTPEDLPLAMAVIQSIRFYGPVTKKTDQEI